MKICITGGPRTGKSMIARDLSKQRRATLFCTDDLIDMGWSEASEHASHWFDLDSSDQDVVIEGTGAVRALRKWLARNPVGKPCDIVYFFDEPKVPLNDGQSRMLKGAITIFNEIAPDLALRGVTIARQYE